MMTVIRTRGCGVDGGGKTIHLDLSRVCFVELEVSTNMETK